MSAVDTLSIVPVDTLTHLAGGPTVAKGASQARIDKTAKDFESSYLSVMFGQMFQGVSTPAPFGGGESEDALRSFLTDAMAKSMVQHGGIGLSGAVRKELLKLQGMT